MSKTTTNRPTHTVFVVEGEGDKTTWTEIGALWSHEDRKGFNLNLKALPLSGRLVIRERKAKTEAKESVGA
ncbi:hypothetical protein [Mesorhizobium huakuii]|uniref:Uncharacterized protein n=1 Tax=Mesorhizobium huakuii TaxID=28104 RepID=A0A7G6T054_9HYPH|nr:hypothetical protein [Mesorhizobium huakuii]QND60136.1 hypothetical protein HB778_29015 [Mesorhizobium huakuii]